MTALLERTEPTRTEPTRTEPTRIAPTRIAGGPAGTAPAGPPAAVRRPRRMAVGPATLPGAESGRARPALMAPAVALRLTRRARLLVTMSVLVGLVVLIAASALNAGPAPGGLRDAPATVVVQPGDTLWGIATDLAPAERPERVVQLLRAANGLGSGVLQPGRELVVPRG